MNVVVSFQVTYFALSFLYRSIAVYFNISIFGAVSSLESTLYGGPRAGGNVRSTQFTYCAVTRDIQLTIDDKFLILLSAQLPRIFN